MGRHFPIQYRARLPPSRSSMLHQVVASSFFLHHSRLTSLFIFTHHGWRQDSEHTTTEPNEGIRQNFHTANYICTGLEWDGTSPLLLRRVHDVSTSDLSLVHHVVHALELRQTNRLERSLDDSAAEELDGFRAVLAVTDIGAADRNHLDDRLEHGCAQVCPRRQTNADDSSARTNVLRTC